MKTAMMGLALATVAIAACAVRTDDATITVPLAATPQNAGEIARAFLISRGEVTDVVIDVSGVPPQVTSRPVHLYTYLYDGACDRLPASPVHALNDRVLAQAGRTVGGATPIGGPFTVANTISLPLDALRRARYAIVIRTSPADGNRDIFCGTIG